MVQSWSVVITQSLQNLWMGFSGFLPSLIGALIIVIVGLIVAAAFATLVEKILEGIKLNKFLHTIGLGPYFDRAGLKLNGSGFLARLVYWFLLVAFLLAASDALGLYAFSGFLSSVLAYVPSVIIAVLVMLAAVVVGNFLRTIIRASVKSAGFHAANFLGSLTWWAVVIFGFFAALSQLNIARDIINTLITGFIAMLAIAGGLAFGLGGRDYAASLVNKLREHTEYHKQ